MSLLACSSLSCDIDVENTQWKIEGFIYLFILTTRRILKVFT